MLQYEVGRFLQVWQQCADKLFLIIRSAEFASCPSTSIGSCPRTSKQCERFFALGSSQRLPSTSSQSKSVSSEESGKSAAQIYCSDQTA